MIYHLISWSPNIKKIRPIYLCTPISSLSFLLYWLNNVFTCCLFFREVNRKTTDGNLTSWLRCFLFLHVWEKPSMWFIHPVLVWSGSRILFFCLLWSVQPKQINLWADLKVFISQRHLLLSRQTRKWSLFGNIVLCFSLLCDIKASFSNATVDCCLIFIWNITLQILFFYRNDLCCAIGGQQQQSDRWCSASRFTQR